MPMGSPCSGGLPLRRAPLRVEDPRAETSGFKESTPGLVSYNKGQFNERLAQAVWARVSQAEACARGRLRRKEGEGRQKPALD